MTNIELIKKTFDSFEKNPEQLGIQSTFTPVDNLANLFNFKKEIEGKKNIGILFNVEFLEYFIREINDIKDKEITYYYDSPIDYCIAWNIVNKYENVELVSIEEFSNTKNIETLKEKIMPKHFDIVFSNPPYSITGGRGGTDEEKNIDLVFLEEVFKQSDRVSFVMTARFMTRKDMKQKRIDLSKYCESITLFEGNAVFGILVAYPLCIINLNKNKKSTDKIKVIDKYYSKTSYEITNLDHFNKYRFEDWELEWWNNFINALPAREDSYIKHCIGWKEFTAPLGYYIGSATSAYDGPRIINDMVTTVDNEKHIFTDKNVIMEKLQSEEAKKTRNNDFFMVPIKTKEDGININKSYKEEIIRAIIDMTKNRHRIYKMTVETLVWPADENGNIKYFTNEDWIKKFNMPESIAKKIITYYNNNPGLSIKK